MAATRRAHPTAVVDTTSWLSREQACDTFGINYDTLESWQRRGLLHPQWAQRGDSRRRVLVYDPQEVCKVPRKVKTISPAEAAGELNARVFELLDAGKTVREIVIKTRETQAKIDAIRDGWLDAGGCDLVVGGAAKAELEKVVGPFDTVIELIQKVHAQARTASNGNASEADGRESEEDDMGGLQRRRDNAAAALIIVEVPEDSKLATATDAAIDMAIVAAIDMAESNDRRHRAGGEP